MKAALVRYEKFIVKRRYVVEISVYQVPQTDKYKDGLKWSLICADRVGNKRLLMDNHHPKGPHIHFDRDEVTYDFKGLDQLIGDFRRLVTEHMGVQL